MWARNGIPGVDLEQQSQYRMHLAWIDIHPAESAHIFAQEGKGAVAVASVIWLNFLTNERPFIIIQ